MSVCKAVVPWEQSKSSLTVVQGDQYQVIILLITARVAHGRLPPYSMLLYKIVQCIYKQHEISGDDQSEAICLKNNSASFGAFTITTNLK